MRQVALSALLSRLCRCSALILLRSCTAVVEFKLLLDLAHRQLDGLGDIKDPEGAITFIDGCSCFRGLSWA